MNKTTFRYQALYIILRAQNMQFNGGIKYRMSYQKNKFESQLKNDCHTFFNVRQ